MLFAIFGEEKPKKKEFKKIRKEVSRWYDYWNRQNAIFESVIEVNVRKIRAMQEVDGLITTVQDILCNVCMTQKNQANKDSLERAQAILEIIRDNVGWNIKPIEVEEDEAPSGEVRESVEENQG